MPDSPVITKWKIAWNDRKDFRIKFIAGLLMLFSILIYFPFFFQNIEQRNGYVINDWLLNHLPSFDLSIPVFSIIWFTALLTLIRAVNDPEIFIVFLYGFIFLSLTRILSISLVPLNPPADLVELKDPITGIFYGSHGFITKDLFYSGHVATQFLLFLCLKRKTDKTITLVSTSAVAVMVLLQHVHYTIDVLAAPFCAWIVYKAALKIIRPRTDKKN